LRATALLVRFPLRLRERKGIHTLNEPMAENSVAAGDLLDEL